VAACAYGDYRRAGTIDPAVLPEVVSESGADIAMVDTAIKDGKPLTSFLRKSELRAFIEESHSKSLWAALAGGLSHEQVRMLKDLKPDVIGVRKAVCVNGNREGKIDEGLVRRLKEVLRA
jgi:hypothetical protein